jgi:hypothetical protein
MQFFYDAAIRRYITQTIRVFSNFVVRYSDGSLHRVPVLYGDADRQVANILRQNSENTLNSTPRISVYVKNLKLDRDRLSDATFVGKMHFRTREIDPETNTYTTTQGRNYTVERLMPTPFKLDLNVDIWAANTDQKLQILEQILVLFNPSLELQTTDNYIDWTSLTVLNLDDVNWSSKQVPVGNNLTIDIATLTVDTPIWISPPVKVKQLGIIKSIVANLYQNSDTSPYGFIDDLGIDTTGPTITLSQIITSDYITISDYNIGVYGNTVVLLGESTSTVPMEPMLEVPSFVGTDSSWVEVFAQYPDKYVDGLAKIILRQPDGSFVTGMVSIDQYDASVLNVEWDQDTIVSNTGIDSQGHLDTDINYNSAGGYRPNSPGTFDAIVNPLTYNPRRPNDEATDQLITAGTRFLIIEDIGNIINQDGPDAWKSTSGIDFIAKANDIIEYDGNKWNVIFDAGQESDTMIWQTNIYNSIQYVWNGLEWAKSINGEYRSGSWRIEF